MSGREEALGPRQNDPHKQGWWEQVKGKQEHLRDREGGVNEVKQQDWGDQGYSG